jgi:fumarate reductase subunit D
MRNVRSVEPLWWFLFAAGGMVAALLVPVHLLINLLIGLGVLGRELISYERLSSLVANPLVKLYLLGLMVPAFFHGAHRIRGVIRDMGVRNGGGLLAVLCYGGAALGSLWALVTVLGAP